MTRKAYKSNLTDTQWQIIEPLIPPAKPVRRHPSVNLREVLNGILYVLRTGCSWEMMPQNTQDRLSEVAVFMDTCESELLQLIWVNAGYNGERFARAVAEIRGAAVEVVLRNSICGKKYACYG